MDKRPIFIAIKTFIISLLIIVGLLTTQLFWIYQDEILNKGLGHTILTKFFLTASLSLLAASIPISVLLSTAAYFRLFFKQGRTASFKKIVLFSLLLSSSLFLWDAFATPKFNTSTYEQLYSIRMTTPSGKLYRYENSNPSKSPMQSNILELNLMIDSLKKKEAELPLNFQSDFEKLFLIESRDYEYERGRMLGLPIFLFVLIYLGMIIGAVNRNNHPLVFFAGFYFFLLPFVYILYYYFLKLSENAKISIFEGHFYPILILSCLTIALFILAKKQLKMTIW